MHCRTIQCEANQPPVSFRFTVYSLFDKMVAELRNFLTCHVGTAEVETISNFET